MKIIGSATIPASRERVWAALQDPATLAATIPGCRSLEEIGADTYAMTISAGVAAIRGSYRGQVALEQPRPPEAFVLRARGQGAPGTVEATVRITLSPDGDAATTRVDYDADAVVGGMVGGVGQRVIAGVARKTADEFFTAVAASLTRAPAPADAGPEGVPSPAAHGAATRRPERAVRYEAAGPPRRGIPGGGTDTRAVLAGAVVGSLTTLAGVVAGALLAGRRASRR